MNELDQGLKPQEMSTLIIKGLMSDNDKTSSEYSISGWLSSNCKDLIYEHFRNLSTHEIKILDGIDIDMKRFTTFNKREIIPVVSNLILFLNNSTPNISYSNKGRFLRNVSPTLLSNDEKEIVRNHFINLKYYDVEISEARLKGGDDTVTIIDRYIHLNLPTSDVNLVTDFPTPDNVIKALKEVDQILVDKTIQYIKEAIQNNVVKHYNGNWKFEEKDSNVLDIPHAFKFNRATRTAIEEKLNALGWDRASVDSRQFKLYIN